MLKEKGILKFKYNDKMCSLHYIKFNNKVVALTKYNSGKISYIKENNNLHILKSSKLNDTFTLNVTISEDISYIKDVYNYMLEKNFTHFNTSYKGLVVLTFE